MNYVSMNTCSLVAVVSIIGLQGKSGTIPNGAETLRNVLIVSNSKSVSKITLYIRGKRH
jgi:hypothetical protein